MPLKPEDRRFLNAVDRMKIYLLLMAGAVLLYILMAPSGELQMTTSILGIALCGVFWLTQRLLSFITILDSELTRLSNALKRSLPTELRRELFGED